MKLKDLFPIIEKCIKLNVYTNDEELLYDCLVMECNNDANNERVVVDIRPLSNSRENYLEVYVE